MDFTDTFSPVTKPMTIRIVLGLAVNNPWPVKQIDVNTAFFQGDLKEEVFIHQPLGVVHNDNPTKVCRLQKALYGLKQALRAWYSEQQKNFVSTGFHNSLSDTSLFILKNGKDFVYRLVYVDDILVICTSKTLVESVLDTLARKFSITDTSDLTSFLGIEAIRTT